MKNIKLTYKPLTIMLLTCIMSLPCWGQVTGDQYKDEALQGDMQTEYNDVSAVLESGNDGDNVRGFACDGDLSTYWRSDLMESDGQETFIVFDLGSNHPTIEYIEIVANHATQSPRKIEIRQSSRADNEGELLETINNAYVEGKVVRAINITQRYVRLVFTRQDAGDYRRIRLYEVSFFTNGYRKDNTDEITIKHKPAKWYDLASSVDHSMDDFDSSDETKFIISPEGQIQNAHTLVDTLYVKKGTSLRLTLPDWLNNTANNRTYQRWYNYRTGKTFATGDNGDVVDLLTPATIESDENMPSNGQGYRFANGYVGCPLSGVPLYAMDFYYPYDGDDWYLVACDVSGYNDYTETFDRKESKNSTFLTATNESFEPTLSHRFIYYIHAVDDQSDESLYPVLEDITMPATRIPNHTQEMVALTRDARGYAIASNADNSFKLDVSLDENNTAGIELTTETLSGEDRVIHFKYPNKRSDNTEYVNTPTDGSAPKATIIVKNGDIEVARFNLTFVEKFRLLSQSQVKELDELRTKNEAIDGHPSWDNLTYRTPYALNSNTDYELLTELNFDFSSNINGTNGLDGYVQDECYPFPLRWTSSTYGFYDGSVRSGDFVVGSQQYPEWGYYGILNGYVECHDDDWGWKDRGISRPDTLARSNSEGLPSRYHLYVDVSDRPGVIARLPFEDKLCNGTELFVTAWVKCARGDEGKENAGALFTIMGIKSGSIEGQTTTEYVPIYRYQTGQIPTTYLNDADINLPGFNQNANIDGARNEWMQVYFSFINKNKEDFDLGYALQIDNNSSGTNGGDIYIDDIRIYKGTVNPVVTQLETNCADEPVRVNVEFNWDRLLSVTGETESVGETNDEGGIMFCVLDKEKYLEEISGFQDKTQDAEAIRSSAVKMGISADIAEGTTNDARTMELHYNLQYLGNEDYVPGGDKALPVINNEGIWYFRVDKDAPEGARRLMTDFYSEVQANRTYIMLVANPGIAAEGDWEDRFEGLYADQCGIKCEFRVVPQNMLRVNGEIVEPSTDFCKGQTYNFTAELRVPQVDEQGNTVHDPETGQIKYVALNEDVYFDWFFGDSNEFTKVNDTYGCSLKDALEHFRERYPNAESVDETLTHWEDGFTEEMFKMLKYYSEEAEGVEGGQYAHPLVLHQQSLNITLIGTLELVAKPIKVELDIDGSQEIFEGIDKQLVCWEYIWLTLNASESAPQVKPGFAVVHYPSVDEDGTDLDPCLRIGLKQIESVKVGNSGDHSLTMNLRYAKFSDIEGADNLKLATVTDGDGNEESLDGLYLVSTDDPEYNGFFADATNFDQYSLPVGRISEFSANSSGPGSSENNKMTFQFNLDEQTLADGTTKFQFVPKEGYTYNLAVHFEEYDGNEKTTACPGHFIIPVKVVPEYVKWTGDGSSNWNNDTNWKRVASGEIKRAQSSDEYVTDGSNRHTDGFVPMLFTKVLMPTHSNVRIYKAGYSDGGSESNWVTERPEEITQDPTPNIQYDLMAYGNENVYGKDKDNVELGDITTQRYRVNICDQIHFEPGAEMLRAEYLLYKRAWTDVEVPTNKWSLVSTPLQDVYSGDWYTQTTGNQATEYFKDITFTTDYNRLQPAVFQRSWDDGATIVENGGSETPVSFCPLWSAAYNDASVEYNYGVGYSINPTKVDVEKALFRFPKADARFEFPTKRLDRENGGKLAASQLVERNTDYNSATEKKSFTVTLTPVEDNGSNYYIIGNPFTSHLNLEKFFETNKEVLQQKYWKIDVGGANGPVVGSADEDGNWISTDLGYLAPYQAMFVQKAANVETDEISFTPEMEVLSSEVAAGQATGVQAMTVKARSNAGESTAALAFSGTADNDFVEAEDAQLMTDIVGNGDSQPYVYTVAGDMATSINRVKDARQIPIGLFADDGAQTTLTFTGVAALLDPTLYDAELNTETPITEGMTLSVDGPSHGRYFIRSRGGGEGTTGITDVTAGDGGVSVYSVERGQVVVSAGAELRDVRVYSVGGALLKSESVGDGRTALTISGVDSGVAIVRVTTADGAATRKITVK